MAEAKMKLPTDQNFTSADFAIFLVVLTIPSFIGVYFAYKDRRNSSTNKYFFGEKKMHPVAVGISTAVTSISAFTMIGYPAEVYIVGTVFAWAPVAIVSAAAITLVYYVPFYGRLKLDTLYGYLELRFNATARRIVAFTVPLSEIFYMGTIIYLPALALNAVAPISVNWSIILTGGICTFYTTLGGMKAVVWTDVVQSIFMLFATITLLIKGLITVGGPSEVIAALERGDRMTFFRFDNFDISSRMHPVAIAVGEFFVFTHYLGFSQPIYQRIIACKSTRQSQYSIVAYIIPAILITCISIANGLLMYAYYEGCDPVKSGLLNSRDQGIPYMALKEFRHLPGMAGLFVAAVFSGTLSTISSGLNAYSAVIVEDFAVPFFPSMSERVKLIVSKVSALSLGVLVVTFAYIVSIMGQNTFKILRCLMGAIGGPVLGIYMLGIFFSCTNSPGAILGGGVAYAVMVWIFLGSNFLLTAPARVELPPISVDECPIINETVGGPVTSATIDSSTIVKIASPSKYGIDQTIYSLNFHYYVLVGSSLTIIIGLLTSFVCGKNDPSRLDPKLFMPLVDNKRLPSKLRNFFRCGVTAEEIEKKYEEDTNHDQNELESLNEAV